MNKALLILVLLFQCFCGSAQELIDLYPGSIPNAVQADVTESYMSGMYRGVTKPTLEVFLPENGKSNGTAVIICPGGGYSVVVYQGEGVNTARELTKNGIAAFVLKYRLPDDQVMNNKKNGPLQDAQQAIKMVRENAEKWGVNPHHVGVMGFSAGGHLASTLATHYENALIDNEKQTSLRPDFQILVYPVISMQDSLTHPDSRAKLLGVNPVQTDKNLFSNELQVDKNTPPAYITHAADDQLVDVDNSILYFEALRHHQVPVQMLVYPAGGHGFIFGLKGWLNPVVEWINNLSGQ